MSYYSNIDFDVRVDAIYDINGNAIAPEIQRGVYPEDTGEVISTCGPKTALFASDCARNITPVFRSTSHFISQLKMKSP